MNRIDFTQPGGFPLDQDVFGFQQLNTFMLQQMAALCGPRAIITGCVEVGLNVTAGYLVIDGEVLPLVAGAKQTKLRIRETLTDMNYEDGSVRPSQVERYVQFGDDGVTTLLWADFKRNSNEGLLSRIDRVEGFLRPFKAGGAMTWWKGAIEDIPAGWREVEGWRGRLPMHYDPDDADFATIGGVAGSKTHTLTIDELPEIIIDIEASENGTSNGSQVKLAWSDNELVAAGLMHSKPIGGGQEHSIVNPVMMGCWIEPVPGYFD